MTWFFGHSGGWNNVDTIIIRSGEKYYFTSDDKVYEINERTLSRLKVRLSHSSDVLFDDCSYEFVGKFISRMFEEPVNLTINKIDGKNRYEVSLNDAKTLRIKTR